MQVLALLAQVLGAEISDLLDLDDRRALPESDLRLIRNPPVSRPERVAATSAAPAVSPPPSGPALVEAAAAESADWARWAEATNVGDLALEQMMADIRALSQEYLVGKPAELFVRCRRLRDRVFHLLEGHQQPRQSSDLYVAAGYLCGLLAWMSSDLGQLRAGDTQGRTAWLCAETAGHDDLRAWVLSTRSKIAFWDGRLRDAINFARRGASYTTTGTVAVLLACQEADAWSMLGAAREARAALERAASKRQSVHGPDEGDGLFSCGAFRQANYETAVLLRVQEPAAALAIAEQTDDDSCFAIGTVAQMRISRARAYLALRDTDGAAAVLRPVLDIPPASRLAPVAERMRELGQDLSRFVSTAGRAAVALRQEMEQWTVETAPRQLALSLTPGITWLDHET
jgi:tetratricopeptide (TPR) repeat protein